MRFLWSPRILTRYLRAQVLLLLALPPQAAAVECPPGLGIALLDRGQPQKVQKPCTGGYMVAT